MTSEATTTGHLLYVWSATGYRVEEREGDPPSLLETVQVGDDRYSVQKIGASPYPGDPRPCAFLIREP